MKQIDIARDCDLSPATLNRIIKSLSDWGYLFRTSEKYIVRNFRLERNVPMSELYLSKLDRTMRALSEQLNVSVEIVVVAGHELLWHSKTDYPDPDVVIRARPGFRRKSCWCCRTTKAPMDWKEPGWPESRRPSSTIADTKRARTSTPKSIGTCGKRGSKSSAWRDLCGF